MLNSLLSISLFSLTVVGIVAFADVDEYAIKCPLVWKKFSLGENLTSDAIPTATYGTEHFIARVNISNIYIGGRWENEKVYVFNPETSNVETFTSNYELLTNPHQCFTDWQPSNYGGKNKVLIDSSKGVYIGRAVVNNGLLSGEISAAGRFTVVNNEKEIIPLTNFQVLRSFSKGLTVEIKDMYFPDVEALTAVKDFVGMDEIINNADIEIRQSVKFMKSVLQRTVVRSSSFTQHTISLGIKGEIGIGGVGSAEVSAGVDFPWGNSEEKEVIKEVKTTVEVTREVIVPPYTAVMVCSTINMLNDFESRYIAKGKYTAPGLTPTEIIDILKEDGKIGAYEEDGKVYFEEVGTVGGTLTMANQFIIMPSDSPEGCSQLQKYIEKINKEQKYGNLTKSQLSDNFDNVNNMIFRMTSQKHVY